MLTAQYSVYAAHQVNVKAAQKASIWTPTLVMIVRPTAKNATAATYALNVIPAIYGIPLIIFVSPALKTAICAPT